MRNLMLLLGFVLFSILSFGQDGESKLKFHSISISPNFYVGNGNTGFMGNLDVALMMKEHIFKASLMSASEIDVCVWGPCYNDQYYSFDLMYGMELLKKRGMAVDLFAGVGYFHFKTRNPELRGYIKKQTIGFPLQGRFRFRDGKMFNLGIQLHANVNTSSSIIAIGPFFQWTFNSRNTER